VEFPKPSKFLKEKTQVGEVGVRLPPELSYEMNKSAVTCVRNFLDGLHDLLKCCRRPECHKDAVESPAPFGFRPRERKPNSFGFLAHYEKCLNPAERSHELFPNCPFAASGNHSVYDKLFFSEDVYINFILRTNVFKFCSVLAEVRSERGHGCDCFHLRKSEKLPKRKFVHFVGVGRVFFDRKANRGLRAKNLSEEAGQRKSKSLRCQKKSACSGIAEK